MDNVLPDQLKDWTLSCLLLDAAQAFLLLVLY